MNLLEYAIKMENDGEAFYREQAMLNRGNGLFVVCEMLANDEMNHARVLKNRFEEKPYVLQEIDTLKSVRNVFADFVKNRDEMKEVEGQLDFYRMALKREQESIDLYSDLLSKSDDVKDRGLFEYLIRQEEDHYVALEELVKLLEHAENWVEHAEFGNREEY